MTHLRSALVIAALVGMTGVSATAESLDASYDPVARAIALGLTPEQSDAMFDKALSKAETCNQAASLLQTMACNLRDVAKSDAPTLPPLES